MNTLFIQTNRKQMLGAKLSRYSFEKEAGPNRSFTVELMVAEEMPELQAFVGKTYLISGGRVMTATFDDLQSFTLTRLKPPELMGYSGRAIVVDPDIFALPGTNLDELFNLDLQNNDLAACRKDNGEWESSMIVLDCAKLKHWRLSTILTDLEAKKFDYSHFIRFRGGEQILVLPWIWNSMDKINSDSKVLHTTRRLTQPWKTGLPIDFTRKPMPKLFGFVPREPLYKLIGRYPTRYLPHPNPAVVDFFFSLAKNALKDGAITETDILDEMAQGNVRPDFFDVLRTY